MLLKSLLLIVIYLLGCQITFSQQKNDSITVKISSVKWMPDGKSLILTLFKTNPLNSNSILRKVVIYDLIQKKVKPLNINGGNFTPSPDGKTIAFVKKNEKNQLDIFFYDILTQKETPLGVDSFSKNNPDWSPDETKLAYNIDKYSGPNKSIEICIVDLNTKKVKQITRTEKYRSYTPKWSTNGKNILYFLEKGDNHDQIYLTDTNGSFHKNLTNDTSTHNYYPMWVDRKNILFTRSPNDIMEMKIKGKNIRRLDNLKTSQMKYNQAVHKSLYLASDEGKELMLYDMKRKNSIKLLDQNELKRLIE